MTTFYCEVKNEFRPEFPNYSCEKSSVNAAVTFFKKTFGDKLEVVYDDKYKIVYEPKE